LKILSKDIQLPIAADKANERDRSLGDVIQIGKLKFWGREDRNKLFFLDRLERGLPLKAAIAVVFIVEEFKVLCLGTKIPITPEPLGPKETAVIRVIEALHGSIPPRLSDGDKDDFDPQGKAKAQDDPKGTRMPVAAPKGQCVVELEKIRDAHGFPTAD
jgi:hypothetical protein